MSEKGRAKGTPEQDKGDEQDEPSNMVAPAVRWSEPGRDEANNEGTLSCTVTPGACRFRALERYRRDGGDAMVLMTKMVLPEPRFQQQLGP